MNNGRKLKRKQRKSSDHKRGTPKPVRRLMGLLWQVERSTRCHFVAMCGQVIQRNLTTSNAFEDEVTIGNLDEMMDRLERRLMGIYQKISMTVLRRIVHFCFVEIQRLWHRQTEPSSFTKESKERLAS